MTVETVSVAPRRQQFQRSAQFETAVRQLLNKCFVVEMPDDLVYQTNAHVRLSVKLQVSLRPFPPRVVRCEQGAENARRFRSAQIGTGLWNPMDRRLSRAFQLKGTGTLKWQLPARSNQLQRELLA